MILSSTSPTAALTFTPNWLEGTAAAPVYHLRAGTVMERELMEAEMAGEYQAGSVWQPELRDAICAGFAALGGEDAETLLALAESHFSGTIEDAAQQAVYDEALDVLARHWPDYRRLVAQSERREAIIRLVAFSRFCCGWENVRDAKGVLVEFRRGADGRVAEAALARIPRFEMQAAGGAAYRLQYPELSAEKNSAPPSPSADGPEISTADAPTGADGSSPETQTNGPKTPE
ncbi:MAG: hypothetical protein KA533_07490 [Sphingobium sp.]|nr:hypothetical protein [Sphingobium sp.]MBP6112580.1 hypothetical protein [Sphingobium sp.]MBP8671626.1 hypothetical protein [Sphingobium sp.]MBP9158610.1 hypothetical protein [Sphingobium sp.]